MAEKKRTGWITLSRKMMDDKVYLSEKFTDGMAWIDLIFLASFKEDNMINVAGKRINIKRGQVGYSQKSLAKRWQWSRSKVKRFLNYLENEHRIEQVNEQLDKRLKTIITITNYDHYQGNGQDNEQVNEHQTNTSRTSNGTVLKNDKKDNNEKEGNALNSSPRKKAKKPATPVRDNPPSNQEILDWCNENLDSNYLDLKGVMNKYVHDKDGNQKWRRDSGLDIMNWKNFLRNIHDNNKREGKTINQPVRARNSSGQEEMLPEFFINGRYDHYGWLAVDAHGNRTFCHRKCPDGVVMAADDPRRHMTGMELQRHMRDLQRQ